MSAETVTQLIERLVQPGPLEPDRFARLLGVALKRGEVNPFGTFYTFELAEGPFASGELRLATGGRKALLILEPRDPPGLNQAEVDLAALGPRLSVVPNFNIPPEGISTEHFQKSGVQVVTQWTLTSRRLYSLVLKWEPAPEPAAAPPN